MCAYKIDETNAFIRACVVHIMHKNVRNMQRYTEKKKKLNKHLNVPCGFHFFSDSILSTKHTNVSIRLFFSLSSIFLYFSCPSPVSLTRRGSLTLSYTKTQHLFPSLVYQLCIVLVEISFSFYFLFCMKTFVRKRHGFNNIVKRFRVQLIFVCVL